MEQNQDKTKTQSGYQSYLLKPLIWFFLPPTTDVRKTEERRLGGLLLGDSFQPRNVITYACRATPQGTRPSFPVAGTQISQPTDNPLHAPRAQAW